MLRYPSGELPSRYACWAPIPLRLIVGYGFLEHGVAKLSKGPDAFVAIVHAMGVPDPHLMAWLTILTELLGGFAVILGAFVAIVSQPMAIVLLVAMFKVHLPYGFSSIKLIAVTAAGPNLDHPVMRSTCSVSPASRPSFWAALDRSLWIDSSASATTPRQRTVLSEAR
jgi:putative oxidoreductase